MTSKKGCCPTEEEMKEIEHIRNVFGVKDLSNYAHTGYTRNNLPYTARDANKGSKK